MPSALIRGIRGSAYAKGDFEEVKEKEEGGVGRNLEVEVGEAVAEVNESGFHTRSGKSVYIRVIRGC